MDKRTIKDELRVADYVFKTTDNPDVRNNIRNYRLKLKKLLKSNGKIEVKIL